MLIFEEESVGSVRLVRRSRSDTEDAYIAQGYLFFFIIDTNGICCILYAGQKNIVIFQC